KPASPSARKVRLRRAGLVAKKVRARPVGRIPGTVLRRPTSRVARKALQKRARPDLPRRAHASAKSDPPIRATGRRVRVRGDISDNDIDYPLRDDNDLFRALPLKRLFYRIESQNGSLNIGISCIAGDRDVGALFAVDLNRQGNAAFHQQI